MIAKIHPLAFWLITFFSMLCKAIPAYIIYVVMVPRLLRNGKSSKFWMLVFPMLLIFLLIQIYAEEIICMAFNTHCYRDNLTFWESLLDVLSQNAMWVMVMLGFLMGISLKFQSEACEKKQKATTDYLQMKVKSLRKQVSPDLLCRTIHSMGVMVTDNPVKTSEILMRLSKLLRYQLYDGKYEKLFLAGELKALDIYLSLMKDNGICADYSVDVTGNVMGVMVPSMLFVSCLPINEDKDNIIVVTVDYRDGLLSFYIKSRHDENDVRLLKERLERIYPGKYKIESLTYSLNVKIQLS